MCLFGYRLFMSSLTTYQIVSAIGSFIVIFSWAVSAVYGRKIDFCKGPHLFSPLSGRTTKMLMGLLISRISFTYRDRVHVPGFYFTAAYRRPGIQTLVCEGKGYMVVVYRH